MDLLIGQEYKSDKKPRKNSNTSALMATFVREAATAGNQITEFHLFGTKIDGCCQGGKETVHPHSY